MIAEDGALARQGRRVLPVSTLGRVAVSLAAITVPVAWVLMSHAIPWDVLDTWVAPVMLVMLLDATAAAALLSVVRTGDRSVLTLATLIIALPLAAFGTLMIAAEILFPH